MKAARDTHHVGGRRLEQLGRDAAPLVAHLDRDARQRAPAERDAPAAERAESLGAGPRVAVDHDHVVGRHTEVIGHDLRERRLVPLAVGARARDRRDAPGTLDLEAAALPAERAGLDVAGEADADDLAASPPLALLAPQRVVVGGLPAPRSSAR